LPLALDTSLTRSPLTGFGSPPECHHYSTVIRPRLERRKRREVNSTDHSSRGLVPVSVLPAMESHLTPARSQPAGYVAPSGFLTLSAPCSPHGLPGLFHPGSAFGVRPSRLCSPTWCRTPSRAPPPSCGWPKHRALASPSGHYTPVGSWNVGLGFSQINHARCPLGLLLLRGFLLPQRTRDIGMCPSPHVLFQSRSLG